MAIKFEKITAGMTLYDVHSHQAGNTTLRTWGVWRVEVIEVDVATRRALVSWNGNRSEGPHRGPGQHRGRRHHRGLGPLR